jgi:hypothetical protein
MEVLSGSVYCAAALDPGREATGHRATTKYTNCNMNQLSRSEYIKLHGIDPCPMEKQSSLA